MTRKAEITVYHDIWCNLEDEMFVPDLTPEQDEFFKEEGGTNCEGSGEMGQWCEGCNHCFAFATSVE